MITARRIRFFVLPVVALLFFTLDRHGAADLDVGIPSGSPVEWVDNIPTVEPDSYRGSIPRKAGDTGMTVVASEPPRAPSAQSVFNYVKVYTWDLPGHLQWYGEPPVAPPEKKIPTGGGIEIRVKYPPQLPVDLFWLSSASYIRLALHPAELNYAETLQYLIYLGHASLAAAQVARRQPSMAEFAGLVEKHVTPIPADPPSFQKARGDYENMMIRLTFEDLITEYPFSLNQRFAKRINLLGDEPVEYVIRAASHEHPFLRRNAVFQLGRYRSKKALEALRAIYLGNGDRDPVVRNRALEALARRGDRGITHDLLRRLRKGDRWFSPYAAWALGMIGDAGTARDLLAYLKSNSNPTSDQAFDAATSAIIALGRLRCGKDRKIIDYLEEMLDRMATARIRDPAPGLRPDVPDPPNTRRDTLVQLLTIALAASDPDKHGKRLESLIEKSKSMPEPDPRMRRFRGGRLATGMLRGFKPMTVFFLLDALPCLPKGRDILREIVLDPGEADTIRARALFKLATATYARIDDLCRQLVDLNKYPPALIEVALKALARSNPKEAVAAAKKLLQDYLAGPLPPWPPQGARRVPAPAGGPVHSSHRKYLAAIALKLLGTRNANNPDTLIRIIKQEQPVRKAEKAKRDAPPPPPNPNRPWGVPGGLQQMEYSTPNHLLEHALLELGRTRAEKGLPVLIDHLKDHKNDARAEACLALGALGTTPALSALVDALEDPDGWIRYMAYRTLRQFADHDFFCDWIYGDSKTRAFAVAQWKAWLEKYRASHPQK